MFKLINPQKIPDHLLKVVDLVDRANQFWNKTLSMQNFSHVDAYRIIQLPLAPILAGDRISWLPTLDREFNVKKVYWFGHKIQSLQQDHPTSSFSNLNSNKFW